MDTEDVKYAPCHSWYDDPEWEYWDQLYAAQKYIINYVRKWSRCRLICKEKYGTIRYEYIFPPGTSVRFGFHITVPYFTKKICDGKVEIPRFRWVYSQSWFVIKWTQYGHWVLRRAVKSAGKKFPNVRQEIEDDLRW